MFLVNIYKPIALLLLFVSCTPQVQESNKPLSPRFNHVFLAVPDVEKSIAFYTAAFDVEVTRHLKSLKRIDENGNTSEIEINIALLQFPGQDFVYEIGERPDFLTPENANASYQHVGIDVVDIDASLQRALEAGATLLRPISEVEVEGLRLKNVFFSGPNGESLELMQIISGEF